jgi:hypothetical protein
VKFSEVQFSSVQLSKKEKEKEKEKESSVQFS